MKAVLRTDGGARGNPGPAGAGFVLENTDGVRIADGGRFLGVATNNVAEYEALLWGLEVARDRGVRDLTVYSDSELLVKQMNGAYRVKNANLKPLFERAKALSAAFGSLQIRHVRREMNTDADEFANRAMDARATVGDVDYDGSTSEQGTLFE